MVGECTLFMWSAHRTPKNQCVCVCVCPIDELLLQTIRLLRLYFFLPNIYSEIVHFYWPYLWNGPSVYKCQCKISALFRLVPECEHNLSNLVNEPVLVCNFGCTNNSTKVFYMYACTDSLGLCCTVWQLFGTKGPFLCLCFYCESMHIVARSKYTCNCGKDSSCEVCTLCSEHALCTRVLFNMGCTFLYALRLRLLEFVVSLLAYVC